MPKKGPRITAQPSHNIYINERIILSLEKRVTLPDEEHLAVLGQRPKFVIHDEFQLIDMVAYLF